MGTYRHTPIWPNVLGALFRVTTHEVRQLPACSRCLLVLRLEDAVPWIPTVIAFGLFLLWETWPVLPHEAAEPYVWIALGAWFPASILLLFWRARRHPERRARR